jgi:SEFIR domain
LTIDDIKNQEDFINYILLQLYPKLYPIPFGDFFMEISPAGGLDAFRNLLDDLADQKLLTRISQPGEPIKELPGRSALDLRYGISINGINHLKTNGLIPAKTAPNDNPKHASVDMEKEVFVTYSWDNEEHNEKVISFTNFLRDKGFNAEMDLMLSQNESAVDFFKMMHRAMTDYKKVIIVLSKGYKEKAEAFKGGVGKEYSLIIKDIESNPKKYILVSFEEISDQIAPLGLKGRQIIDLSDKKYLNELFAKLKDEKTIEFSPIREKKPEIEKKAISKFIITDNNLEIVSLKSHPDNSSQYGQVYSNIEFDLTLEIKNNTQEEFSDYNIEVSFPINATGFDVNGRIDGDFKIVTYEATPKIFTSQTKSIKLDTLIVRSNNAKKVLESKIDVKIYTKNGVVEKTFPLADLLIVKHNYVDKSLTPGMFQD